MASINLFFVFAFCVFHVSAAEFASPPGISFEFYFLCTMYETVIFPSEYLKKKNIYADPFGIYLLSSRSMFLNLLNSIGFFVKKYFSKI